MNQGVYDNVRSSLLAAAEGIQNAKRPGYTVQSPDILANFHAVADRAGMTARQAWLVYFLKHVDALSTWARFPEAPQAEGIEGRFADVINYCQLGFAIEVEEALEAEEARKQHVAQTAHPSFTDPAAFITNEQQEQADALRFGPVVLPFAKVFTGSNGEIK